MSSILLSWYFIVHNFKVLGYVKLVPLTLHKFFDPPYC